MIFFVHVYGGSCFSKEWSIESLLVSTSYSQALSLWVVGGAQKQYFATTFGSTIFNMCLSTSLY